MEFTHTDGGIYTLDHDEDGFTLTYRMNEDADLVLIELPPAVAVVLAASIRRQVNTDRITKDQNVIPFVPAQVAKANTRVWWNEFFDRMV